MAHTAFQSQRRATTQIARAASTLAEKYQLILLTTAFFLQR